MNHLTTLSGVPCLSVWSMDTVTPFAYAHKTDVMSLQKRKSRLVREAALVDELKSG